MDEEQFTLYVDQAIASLPDKFQEKLDNVIIVVEEYPTKEQYQRSRMLKNSSLLLGLYEGIPQTKRGSSYGIGATLPDKITIFKAPILSIAGFKDGIAKIIHDTVLHEIAHHFGMDEEAVRKAEMNRKKRLAVYHCGNH